MNRNTKALFYSVLVLVYFAIIILISKIPFADEIILFVLISSGLFTLFLIVRNFIN